MKNKMLKEKSIEEKIFEVLKLRLKLGLDCPSSYLALLMYCSEFGIKLLYDQFGKVSGYILFTLNRKESTEMLFKYGQYPQHASERNEGKMVIIFDLVMREITISNIRTALTALKEYRVISYIKNHQSFIRIRKKNKTFKKLSNTLYSYPTKISKVLFINMSRNIFKNIMMRCLLKKFPYNYSRSAGFIYNPENLEHQKLLPLGCESYMKSLSPQRQKGVIGCWLAHMNTLSSIKSLDGYTVILEDDFFCTPKFFNKALEMISSFKAKHDVIVFDCLGEGPKPQDRISNEKYKVRVETFPHYYGSHCYFIKNSSVDKILMTMRNSKVKDFDGFLLRNDEFESFIFYSGESTQIYMGSNLCENSGKLDELINLPLRIFRMYKEFFFLNSRR